MRGTCLVVYWVVVFAVAWSTWASRTESVLNVFRSLKYNTIQSLCRLRCVAGIVWTDDCVSVSASYDQNGIVDASEHTFRESQELRSARTNLPVNQLFSWWQVYIWSYVRRCHLYWHWVNYKWWFIPAQWWSSAQDYHTSKVKWKVASDLFILLMIPIYSVAITKLEYQRRKELNIYLLEFTAYTMHFFLVILRKMI